MANNQLECGVICEKIAIRAGDDERIIYYEWPNPYLALDSKYKKIAEMQHLYYDKLIFFKKNL